MPKDGKIEFDGTYRTDSYNKVLSANQRIARRDKKKSGSRFLYFPIQYPDPGSNRDGLLHWCLRPARLPIPPSGLVF